MKSCYMMHDEHPIPTNSSWLEAEQFCQSHNGHLFSINTEAEYLTVIEWLVNKRWKNGNQDSFASLHLPTSWIFLGLVKQNQVQLILIYN